MRILIIVTGILALLYAGYWVVGSTTVERGARTALEGLQEEGWQVRYGDLSTRGFPSRFDTTATGIDLFNPATGFGWQAPFVQVFALSYRPTEVIAVWPETQDIVLPGQTLTLTSDRLRASASLSPGSAVPLSALTLEAGSARIASDAGWQVAAGQTLIALRASSLPDTFDAYAETFALMPQDALRWINSASLNLPDAPATLRLDAQIGLTRLPGLVEDPDGSRVMGEVAQLDRVVLRDLRLVWDDMQLTGAGEITIGDDGTPDGRITLKIDGWREMITLAAQAGLVDPEIAPTWENVAAALTQGQETFDLPISFSNGMMSVGPMPLGPAPRLR